MFLKELGLAGSPPLNQVERDLRARFLLRAGNPQLNEVERDRKSEVPAKHAKYTK